ncbi:hypothetical protein METBIDRAFT_42642 [Metschnikowia bicuspidata var. bicuspidata NRRL YB-4993]|uniref:Uncharacterized protein n=1 Tax=Metschnikowia bicuspidata var. bicuspidata NRRL YB-4993 TaxID=869754 RepID=A0A1A0HAN1_9ASCO|nr:hypothetical protein METBIDRAFT_42642 [Metschnikowia bicuspidata var. bicuspidata NRRL YB-4993]OBA21184.1 hypothetical protein METBIDRAFT_42642 [Metschnikowia bicuspidata var. bicuspidata NRRL YB-4993]
MSGLRTSEKEHYTVEKFEPDSGISPASPTDNVIKPRASNLLERTESKKPIKFTVRKISREGGMPIEEKGGNLRPITQRYGNLPENKSRAIDRKMGDKAYQLKHNQSKYDEYVTRIDKIEKEVRFLSTLLPPYNVEIDYPTRLKITRAIEKLRSKKDEIEKRKYDLGMSISRLWREFDENNTWVRSVSKH